MGLMGSPVFFGFFGFFEAPKDILGTIGFSWVSVGFPWVRWVPLGFFGFFRFFEAPKNILGHFGTFGFSWVSVGSPWVWWVPLGFLGSLGFLKFQRTFWIILVHLGSHGYL